MTPKPGISPGFVVSVAMIPDCDRASILNACQYSAIDASHGLNDCYGMVRRMFGHHHIHHDISGAGCAGIPPWGRQ
ncbi:hypothetical protein ISN76_06195 [Dyella halodurans]|uniref:Uncharacterized protein n=1 Tax=Dyella halodurans TaxID=1920171 RepID=A0ABV9C5T5_9GAMM|nr:hypothetical protein [Dyella halodurans]